MKRYFALAVIIGILTSGASAQQTKVLTADKHNEYGLVYSLPTTALQIKVTAVKEMRKAGPYRQYAKKYLGKTDVITQDGVSWNITGIEVTPFGVKDDDTQYLMQLKPGQTTFIGVASNGMLLSINAEPESDFDFDRSAASASEVVRLQSDGPVDEYLQYVDVDFVSAQNSMRQAEMISSSLMDVRDAYLSLTRGTADNMPSDGRQLELMLNSLKKQEDALTRAFTGSVETTKVTRVFTYIPEGDAEEVLFRLSDFGGIVDADDFSGSPVYIKTEVMMEGSLPVDAKGETKKFPKDGVVYTIPGTARIAVYSADKEFYATETEFSQFGVQFALAPSLFTDKKNPSYARFSPVTGGLIEIGAKPAAE